MRCREDICSDWERVDEYTEVPALPALPALPSVRSSFIPPLLLDSAARPVLRSTPLPKDRRVPRRVPRRA